uniref:Double-strand-break repair protein rad21 homolog n=1 Tax=Cacopsylla melanoneura TaxID=428564 RepID=A0A8D8MCM6_9HEMI
MFYAQFVLAKKGPLARIWLAAHWDKKLTKAHVFETNIEKSVDGILQPKVKMALRTSGHLLLGVVRIYSRKAKYLLADCNEAFVKIKMAFRPGMVDLPEDNREAAVNAITLPEVFHDFDTTMPELNDVDIEAQFSLNQSRAEEITMREDYGHAPALDQEDGFDLNFDEEASELIRNHPYDQDANMLFEDGPLSRVCDQPQFTSSSASMMNQMEIDGDAFSGNLNADNPTNLFALKLFDDTPMGGVDISDPPAPPSVPPAPPDSDDDDHFGGAASPMGGHPSSDDGSRPGTPEAPPAVAAVEAESLPAIDTDLPPPSSVPPPPSELELPAEEADAAVHTPVEEEHMPPPPEPEPEPVEHTQLLHNEEESFALAPIDASVIRGFTKTKRKRKLIVDEVKNISGEEMKSQLSDTSDIVITLDLAPPTKRLMHWKESGGVEKLFALSGRPVPSRVLFKMYQRHLTSRSVPAEDHQHDQQDQHHQPPHHVEQEQQHPEPQTVEPVQTAPTTRRTRKRKPMEPIEENYQQEIPEPVEPPRPLSVPPMQALPEDDGFLKPQDIPQQPATPMTPMLGPDLSLPPESPYRTAPPTPLHEIQQHLHNIPEEPALVDQTPSFTNNGVEPAEPFTPQTSMFMENMGYVQQDHHMEPHLQETPQTPLLPPGSVHDPHTMSHDPHTMPHDPHTMSHDPHTMPHDPHTMPPDTSMMANMGYDETHPPATTPGALSEKGQATPYHEDYDMPVSVGPQEEQATDETYEQFEERVLNKRAAVMYRLVKTRMDRTEAGDLYLSDLTHRNSKKAVAQKFYSLLVLKKFKVLNLGQEVSYGEIHITRGANFDNPSL